MASFFLLLLNASMLANNGERANCKFGCVRFKPTDVVVTSCATDDSVSNTSFSSRIITSDMSFVRRLVIPPIDPLKEAGPADYATLAECAALCCVVGPYPVRREVVESSCPPWEIQLQNKMIGELSPSPFCVVAYSCRSFRTSSTAVTRVCFDPIVICER